METGHYRGANGYTYSFDATTGRLAVVQQPDQASAVDLEVDRETGLYKMLLANLAGNRVEFGAADAPATTTPQKDVPSASSGTDWQAIKAAWPAEWTEGFKAAVALHVDQARNQQREYQAKLETFIAFLNAAWADLEVIHANLSANPSVPFYADYVTNFNNLRNRYYILASGIMASARPAAKGESATEGRLEVGAAPFVVGAVVFGLAAVCFAAAYLTHAQQLREWTAYLRADLDARVEAMRTGKTLPPADVPTDASGDKPGGKDDSSWGIYLGLGVLAALAVATVTPVFKKR